MGPRIYLPFDLFAMRVAVPVSSFVRDGQFGWSCGQCPIGREGEVLFSGDLLAQSAFVCEMIEGVLPRADFDSRSIGKLNVYYVESRPGEGDRAIEQIARYFPHGPVIVPIPVPHFYYEGMLLEVDVFTGPRVSQRTTPALRDISLQVVEGGDTVWASVDAPLPSGVALAGRLAAVASALEKQGLFPGQLLSDHWFLSDCDQEPGAVDDALSECDLISSPGALVRLGPRPSASLVGELTFSRDAVQSAVERDEAGTLALCKRRGGPSLWISGVQAEPQGDLVDQTGAIMAGIERSLASEGMSFGKVVKLTAHYVGGASAEELHGNMAVRHGYYANPGPASTGLPVKALQNPHGKIAIDVLARA